MAAAEAAAAAGAPWVAVWTAASCALLAHLRTDALRQDVGDQGTCVRALVSVEILMEFSYRILSYLFLGFYKLLIN